jgi:hypothetical protein
MALMLDPEHDVVLCHMHDAMYMEEFLTFIITLTRPPLPIVRYIEYEEFAHCAGRRNICVRRIPECLLRDGSASIVYVNTEQLSAAKNLAEFHRFTRRPDIDTFDYSKANIRLSGSPRHFYFPLLENATETEQLLTILRSTPKTHDVAVLGTPTARRLGILQELQSSGVDVVFIQGFLESRDRRIAECRVLLNLHAMPDFTLYEPLRCDRWVHAGMVVVTEPCSDADALPPCVRVTNSSSSVDIISTLVHVLEEL